MSETVQSEVRKIKVGYFSMGLSSILAGILLVLNQLGYETAGGIYILWPVMMIMLGLEIIISKFVAQTSKSYAQLRPAWGVLFICILLVACSQVWIMLMNSAYINW